MKFLLPIVALLCLLAADVCQAHGPAWRAPVRAAALNPLRFDFGLPGTPASRQFARQQAALNAAAFNHAANFNFAAQLRAQQLAELRAQQILAAQAYRQSFAYPQPFVAPAPCHGGGIQTFQSFSYGY